MGAGTVWGLRMRTESRVRAHDRDDARIRASSRRIGLLVGVSSAVVIALGVVVLTVVIRVSSRPEHGAETLPADPDRLVVDVDDVLPGLIGFGVVAVLLLGVVAWSAARRSVRPLAQALRSQRAFVADASHELRTPLSALVSRVQIVERRLARGEPVDEAVAKLRRDADAMSDTLTDLLTAAAADSDAPAGDAHARADAGAALVEALERMEPLAQARGVLLTREAGSAQPAIVGVSPPALARLCVVLIDNAVHHSPDGGIVRVRCTATADSVQIRVEDQGDGIAPDDQSRIFERFARGPETGHRRGFGLGLYLAREIAERAGGSLVVEVSSSDGTGFLLDLPRLAEKR